MAGNPTILEFLPVIHLKIIIEAIKSGIRMNSALGPNPSGCGCGDVQLVPKSMHSIQYRLILSYG